MKPEHAEFLNAYTAGRRGPALLNAVTALRRHFKLNEETARNIFTAWLNA